ncbi:MAG: hypothetical protein AABZ11_11805 [Nitrospinota bacterium]
MEIANSMKGITEDIISSYNIRVKAFADLAADTQKTLEDFASERKERSEEQAEGLSNFVEGLSKGTRDMMKGFRKNRKQMSEKQTKMLAEFIKNLSGDVGSMLHGFQKGRVKMSKDLKGMLTMSVGNIVGETRKLLGEYSSDMKMAAHAWQDMCKALSAARKNSAVVSVEGTKKEEAVFHEAEMEEKILKLVRRHPEGLKVGDMKEHLGIVSTKLGAVAKRLLEEGKIRKEENLYFPL